MVCKSPPAENARPSPWITSTLMSSDASTSAPSCSSFLAIDRSMELKAAGRLSVMVAIGPSMASSAGSSEWEALAGVGMDRPPDREWCQVFKSQKARGDNPRRSLQNVGQAACSLPHHNVETGRNRDEHRYDDRPSGLRH